MGCLKNKDNYNVTGLQAIYYQFIDYEAYLCATGFRVGVEYCK